MAEKQETKQKKEKKENKENGNKKKKKGRVGIAAASAAFLMFLGSFLSVFLGYDPFNMGYGDNGPGMENVSQVVDSISDGISEGIDVILPPTSTPEATSTPVPAPEKNIVTIKIEGTMITVGDIPCENAAAVQAVVINQYNGTQEYKVIYTTAIDETYKQVKDVMQNLKESLGLSVSYEK